MEKDIFDFSKQLDYISYMLTVRTAGKKYENIIVNAIYSKVGNPDLVPVTQQYVMDPNNPGKYYLLDLYFPQLNYGIEIDEKHHLIEGNKLMDIERAEAIKDAIGLIEGHIPINNDDKSQRTYSEVCDDINREVAIIRSLISEKGTLEWQTNDDLKKEVIAKGKFSSKDPVYYDSVTEIYNICGGKRSGSEKGKDAKSLQRCYYRLNKKYCLWVPKLTAKIPNDKMGYNNILSEDFNEIRSVSKNYLENPYKDIEYKRVTFLRTKDKFGKAGIMFIGVYELTKESKDAHRELLYRRIAEEIKIDDLKF